MATFKPGNPTDPFPPNQPVGPPDKPTFPGNPTDPLPTPTPVQPPTKPTFPGNPTDPFPPSPTPTPTRPEALLSQVETQGQALDAGLRSVLDTLASTVGTTAQQSKAALDQVTNALRNQLKQTSGQQSQQLDAVVSQIVNAANSNATISQTALDSIVNTLAAAPVPQYGSPVEVMPSEVAGRIAAGWKCSAGPDPHTGFYSCQPPITVGTGTGTQQSPFSSVPIIPPPTLTPSPVAPTLQPAPATPPKPNCNSCIITDDKGLWVESFNNLSAADAVALTNQVKMTPGYNITCFPMADQNCIPTLHPPFWSPPPKIVPPTGGGGGGSPVVPIVAPILVGGGGGGAPTLSPSPTGGGGGGIAPTLSPTGGGGAPTLSPTGGGGGAPTLSPTGGGGAPTLSPTGGGSPTLTPTGGGSPTLSPTGSPIPPTLSPTGLPPSPPPLPPPSPGSCQLPPVAASQINQLHIIGDQFWCANLPAVIEQLSTVGNSLLSILPSKSGANLMLNSTMDSTLRTALSSLPFGVGDALIALFEWSACTWDKLVSGVSAVVSASTALFNAATCSNASAAIGLVLLRSALQSLRNLRIGSDAGFWATIDITVEWTQADKVVEYLIRYVCPYIIPGSSEAMELVRGGWITPQQYQCWMKMNGCDIGVWSPVLEHGRPRPGLYERQRMLWRLRPDDNDLGQSFNNAQYEASLLQDGYNEQWANLLDAIKYNAYTLREIRELLDSGVIGHDETLAAFKDMGFDPARAEVLAQMELTLTKRRRESEIVGLTPARISSLYARGKFTDSDVSLYMQALSFSEQQAERLRQTARYENDAAAADHFLKAAISEGTTALRDAYTTGTVADADAVKNLMSLGAPETTATALVQVWAATITTRNAKTGIAALKRGWDSGYMGGAAALINLEHTGLTNANAAATLAQWELERAANEHLLTVQQILAQVATGQTSAIDAAARLHNMGWYADDANILIANAESKLAASIAKQAESVAKAMAAAEKSAASQSAKDAASKAKASIQAAKAAEQLAKHAAEAMKLGEQQLKRITPVSTLRSWLKEGYISAAAFQSRMVLMGNPPEVAQLMADEICNKKGANCVDKDGPSDNVLTDSASAGGAGI